MVECPESFDRLTWSRLRKLITCARTARVVQTQEVNPITAATVTAPRLLEFLFQAAGLWLIVRKETMALPTSLARAVFHRPPEEAKEKRLYALVEVHDADDHRDAHDDHERDPHRLVGGPAGTEPERRPGKGRVEDRREYLRYGLLNQPVQAGGHPQQALTGLQQKMSTLQSQISDLKPDAQQKAQQLQQQFVKVETAQQRRSL
mgnify:CR=1 FL=1